jgi:hypothetical protein
VSVTTVHVASLSLMGVFLLALHRVVQKCVGFVREVMTDDGFGGKSVWASIFWSRTYVSETTRIQILRCWYKISFYEVLRAL